MDDQWAEDRMIFDPTPPSADLIAKMDALDGIKSMPVSVYEEDRERKFDDPRYLGIWPADGRRMSRKHTGKAKRIRCVNTGEVFPSINAAAKWLSSVGLPVTGRALAASTRSGCRCRGYHWQVLGQEVLLRPPNCVPIVHLKTGTRYDSVSQAARETGISDSTIRYWMRRGEEFAFVS